MSIQHVIGNRYLINDPERDLVGHGAMGNVYRGTDIQTEEQVAIKALKPEIVAITPGAVERFEREGLALRQLDHPNIVKMLAAVKDNNLHYLIMEYVRGGSLHDLIIRDGALPADQVIDIALDLADALTRAHRLHITHRDVKPGNVMLAKNGTARLTDFGVAHFEDQPNLTSTGTVIGSYAYLSPESCAGQSCNYDTDIWALGVMLYEMLAGERPFKGDNPAALLSAILMQPTPHLKSLRADIPTELTELVYQMLDKNPATRLSSARIVGACLEVLKGVYARPSELTYTPSPLPVNLSSLAFATPTPSPPVPLHNLPTQTTPFIGRERELTELVALLQDQNCHLLTLIGPDGMGKSRLAIEIANQQLEYFSDGIFYVPLVPLTSPNAIISAIADSLKFSFMGPHDPQSQLIEFLHHKQLLLLMDNFEHVIEGADILADILDAAHHIKVIATSLVRLNLPAECLYEVHEMAFRTEQANAELEELEAVQMFLAYAQRTQPGYAPSESDKVAIGNICELVEGIPLGIELAAAWVRMLTPSEIVRELEDSLDFLETNMRHIPERHRSMRAAFDYSWELLSEGEQTVFMNLSVFHKGFTRETASHIATASLITLMNLVDKSLLQRDASGRFHIHETIRRYAAEKLDGDFKQREQLLDKHCEYYATFLHQQEAYLRRGGRKYGDISQEIEVEFENIRAAWNWAVSQKKIEVIGKAVYALGIFYDLHGWFQESLDMLKNAVHQLETDTTGDTKSLLLGKLLAMQGFVDSRIGEGVEANELFTKSLALLDKPEYQEERGIALTFLSTSRQFLSGNYTEAKHIAEQSLAIHREFGNLWGVGVSLNILALANNILGDHEQAKNYIQESIVIWNKLGSKQNIGRCLGHLGYVANEFGEYEDARQHLQKALEIAVQFNDRWFRLYALNGLGEAALGLQEPDTSRQNFEQVLKISFENNLFLFTLSALAGLGRLIAAIEPETAVRISTFILNHPIATKPVQDKMQRLLNELERQLPIGVFIEAQSQGTTITLEKLVADQITHL